jgi:hypothetical protein
MTLKILNYLIYRKKRRFEVAAAVVGSGVLVTVVVSVVVRLLLW